MCKKWFVVVMMCGALFTAGCGSSTGAAIGGALVGGAASQTFAGIEADLQRAKEIKFAEYEAALERLEQATTEVEKAAEAAKVKALEQMIQDLQDTQQGIVLAKEGIGLNWSDPEAVGGYGGALTAAILAWYFRRKGKASEAKYTAHKRGAELFMRENSSEGVTLYKGIGVERDKLSI